MKKLHILSLAGALAIGTATVGFAATSSDSTGGPAANTTNPSTTTTVVPGSTSSAMTGPGGPYATPSPAPKAATVGPTGSMTRDAANPNGASRPGGGDSGGGGGGAKQ
jgi:hypothetical protein